MSTPETQTQKTNGHAKPPRRRRAVQQQIPGTETPRDPKLTQLATNYRDARDNRMQDLAVEIDEKQKLIAYMQANGITQYRDVEADLIVEIVEGKTKVKVKTLQQEHDEDEAE